MSRSSWTVVLGAALCAYAVYAHQQTAPQPSPCPCTPKAPDKKPDAPKRPPSKPRGPCGPGPCPSMALNAVSLTALSEAPGKPVTGGTDSPDGTVHILFLPPELDWPRNIPAKGLGCCGFRSFDYCGRVQNVPEVVNLPEKLRDAGIAGGDYPQKHSQIVAKLCPGISWWQDTGRHIELVQASCRSQRPCCVDYNGHDPHYRGQIAHCVTCVACDVEKDWVAILDNNFPSLAEIVWMSVAEFQQRWGGWSYGLLAETPGTYRAEIGNQYDRSVHYENLKPLFGRLEGPFGPGETTIDGAAASIEDILDRFGGDFMPVKKPIPVNVDHKIDLEGLQGPVLAFAGAAFVLWIIASRKDQV